MASQDIETSFDDIGGLDSIKSEIYQSVVMPFRLPELAQGSSLRSPPRGVLLHGPPGTGKTMLASAIAKECGRCFINVSSSAMQSMYMGESVKFVHAIFSLAELLSPAIIFLDETDSFFADRDVGAMHTHEVLQQMKTEFLTMWDGLTTSKHTDVVVIGATNRMHAIDSAALRRFARTFYVALPDATTRAQILAVQLQEECVDHRDAVIAAVAARTETYSGADLKEVCRFAAQLPMRECMAPAAATHSTLVTPVARDSQLQSQSQSQSHIHTPTQSQSSSTAFISNFARRHTQALQAHVGTTPLLASPSRCMV
jgi:SpoVK/Ycf46/Vps4 family AAA+-type ATPase